MAASKLITLNSPWSQHCLTKVRDTLSSFPERSHAIEEVSRDLVFTANANMPLTTRPIDTPTVEGVSMPTLDPEFDITMIHVMRAGIGFQSTVTALRQAGFPITQEIYLEAERDEKTLDPEVLACKLPKEIRTKRIMFGEPMCATGGSTALALEIALERAVVRMEHVACLHFFATAEGLSHVGKEHPGVVQICAAIDPELNDKGYIVPGCGDFGNLVTGVTPYKEDVRMTV